MELLVQVVAHIPWWVFALFAYLVMRGLKARRPGETTLFKLAVIPVLLLLMGINELWRVFGFAVPEALV